MFVYLIQHGRSCCIYYLYIYIYIYIQLSFFPFLVDARTLYVSKAYGNDSNGHNHCDNKTSPCKTLSHVIGQAVTNDDVIQMDSKNTTLHPYNNCSSKTLHRNLTFISWQGFPATINCSGRGLIFAASSNASGEVHLHGLKFVDTFVNLTDLSLNVTNCSFSLTSSPNSTFQYLLDVSFSKKKSSTNHVTITSSSFTNNSMTGCLRLANRATTGVFLEIKGSYFLRNILPKNGSLLQLLGRVNFNFSNSEISYTTFSKTEFLENGMENKQPSMIFFLSAIDTESEFLEPYSWLNNTLLTKEPQHLSVHVLGGKFHENEAANFFALFDTPAHVTFVHTNFTQNKNSRKPGAVVVLNSSTSLEVHFKVCEFTSNRGFWDASAIYLKVDNAVRLNASLESCSFNNNANRCQQPADCKSEIGSTVFIDAMHLILSVTSCSFEKNNGTLTGAIYLTTSQHGIIHFDRTNVTSCISTKDIFSDKTSGGITVFFKRSQDAALWSGARQETGLWIERCLFYKNAAITRGAGAVVVKSTSVYNGGYPGPLFPSNISITSSNFTGNLAQNGTGAISILSNFQCHISDTVFNNNAGFEGGAVYCYSGNLTLRNCKLNTNYGGSALLTTASGSLRLNGGNGLALIQDCKFVQSRKISPTFGKLSFHGGVAVSSNDFRSLILSNSTFDFGWKRSNDNTVVMEFWQTKFVMDNSTMIRCPVGYEIVVMSEGKNGGSFQCSPCTMGTYSEDRGYYHFKKKHSAQCFPCPYGAKCMPGLEVLPNFWGYRINSSSKPTKVAFSLCPLGYCCQPEDHNKSCAVFNTCNAHRRGRLCGECEHKFSETLFSPTCRKSEKCNDSWFWPVAVVFILGFSLYMILQPDFITILWNWITWFSRDAGAQPLADGVAVFDPGYERIMFFYYQATQILLVRNSIDVLDKYLGFHVILGLFNFEVRLSQDGFCPFPGLSSVSKIFFQSLGVFSVLFAIPAIFVLHYAACVCLRRARPKKAPYFSAFVKAIFLGYAILMEKGLTLLSCHEVDGVNCLFVNCTIMCYTWWQKLIGTSVAVVLFPFALMLFFGLYKLFDKQISVSHFLFACLLPLPYLSYWFLARRNFRAKHVPDSDERDAITSVLTGSYRAPDHVNRGAIYWESVLIARILVLILADVLIKEPLMRSLTLLLICVLNLSVHIYVFPFEVRAANRVETISLFCLVLAAILGVPYSGYLSEGVVASGPISDIMNVFSWCQVILVIFLPAVFVLIVFAAAMSQAVRLFWCLGKCFLCSCYRCFCCKRCVNDQYRNEELSDPLVQ